jgi:glycine amidinotransferase
MQMDEKVMLDKTDDAAEDTGPYPETKAPGSAPRATVVPRSSPVMAFNEWDPLEEVIVGRLEGSTVPSVHVTVTYNLPPLISRLYRIAAGHKYPRWLEKMAQKELDGFIAILKGEGITVRRPALINHRAKFKAHGWSSRGFCVACPRDGYMIVGDEIIETPMAWRSRYFEGNAYRPLFKEYFEAGARWTAAPRPELKDDLFDYNFRLPEKGEPLRYVVNEFEPVFDAADFVRCGRDLFVIRSNVTNLAGINWLRRHLGDQYTIHELPNICRQPMHIDSSFMPLAPGKVLVNPDYIDVERLPPILKKWDVLIAPRPDPVDNFISKFSMCSPWTSINFLSLDEKKVVVESKQPTLIKALKNWGFDPIPCDFMSYGPFGGAFHCATLDVRRRGTLQSYF